MSRLVEKYVQVIRMAGLNTNKNVNIGGGATFTLNGVQILVGAGAPTASAAQGSLYLRTDGSSTSTRLYVSAGGTTWVAVTTAS
jgi:hypothetical protein